MVTNSQQKLKQVKLEFCRAVANSNPEHDLETGKATKGNKLELRRKDNTCSQLGGRGPPAWEKDPKVG